jgi:hypothetical protein
VTRLGKVQAELERYEHRLVEFSARERGEGVELVIALREPPPGAHVYVAPLHSRDIDHAQFPWHMQRHLYDCLHDYLVELFVRTP